MIYQCVVVIYPEGRFPFAVSELLCRRTDAEGAGTAVSFFGTCAAGMVPCRGFHRVPYGCCGPEGGSVVEGPALPAAARRGKRCFPKERSGTKACAGYGPAWNVLPGCLSPAFSVTVSLPPPSLFFPWAAGRFSYVRRSTGRGRVCAEVGRRRQGTAAFRGVRRVPAPYVPAKKKPRLFGKAGPRVTCFCCGIRTGAGRCRIFSPCSSRCGSSTSSRARP